MFCNRGIYHEGWTAVTRHSTPWVIGAELPAVRRRRLGALRHPTDWTPGARPRRRAAREARRAAAAVPRSRRVKYNVLPLDDRRVERFNSDLAGRPTLIQGNVAAAVRRHGPPHRELGPQHEEQVALGHGRDRRARGRRRRRDHRAGRRVRRLEPLRSRTASRAYCYNLFGLAALQGRRATRRCPPATHQVRMEFAYDGGGLAKGGDGDALRRRRAGRRGPRRGDRADDVLGRRDRRRRQRHRLAGERRLHAGGQRASPAPCNWVQIDIDEAPRTSTT